MSKIYITGIVASGKTTLAKQLSTSLGIPWHELDTIVLINNKQEGTCQKRTPEQQLQIINDIDSQGSWIIEGCHRKSCDILFDRAELIIFLDTPLWKRRLRIFTRFIKQQLGLEPCHYKSDFAMLKWMYECTNKFERDRESFEATLAPYRYKLQVIESPRQLRLD